MSNLQFVETHNLIAFLEKPTKSAGFEEIIDFLKASSIRYALTINPAIYTLYIKQFWATAKAKTFNGEVDLQLVDENGTGCLPNATIFVELERMGYEKLSQKLTFYKAFFSPQWKYLIHTILQCLSAKTIALNEFSSTMASTIICLATNKKFNFSKYIFDNMVKNVDSMVKFWMYPRFVQLFMDKQVGDMSTHDEIYVTPSHTKKVFGNIKRVGKGFSGNITPLFPTMMVQAQEEMGEADENVTQTSNDPLLSGEDRLKLNELMELCTKLQSRVLDLENTKTTQALEIDSLKRRVKKLEKKQRSRTQKLKRLYKVSLSAKVVSSEDEGLGEEDASKQGRKIHDIDADEDIILENVHDAKMFDVKKQRSRTQKLKRLYKVSLSAKVVSSEDEGLGEEDASKQGRIIHDIDVDKDIILENVHDAKMFDVNDLNSDEVFVEKEAPEQKVSIADPVTTAGEVVTTASVEEVVNTATITTIELTLAQTLVENYGRRAFEDEKKDQVLFDKQEALRLQAQFDKEDRIAREKEEANAALIAQWNDIQDKVKDDKEREELKQWFEIFPEEEIAIDVIPLATKPAPIKVVKAKHGYTMPEEAYESVLWGDLKVMFEPQIEDAVWRNLQGHSVKLWKLYDSCGVHFVRFDNMHVYMLVEKKYYLIPSTLTDMLNKKLHADYWNEMCYQLLKIITKQLKNPGRVGRVHNTSSWNHPTIYCDDDDDDDEDYTIVITPDLPIANSLIMEDEHLDTISATESDELIKFSVENLVQIPSESEDLSDGECDLLLCDHSPKSHLTFSNPLFDANDDFTSSDDESFSEEDVPIENFKIFFNPLFDLDEEIISTKIDFLLDEFAGKLNLLKLIPLGIDEAKFDPERDTSLIERLLYDNSSPRPPKELNVENSIESFSPSPIPVEDSDSLMEEIDLFLTPDDSMLPGIENDDYDSEGDIIFLEELLSNDSPSLPENESFYFDIPSSPRPPEKPPDDDEIKPDTGVLTAKVVEDASKHYVLMPRLLPNQPILCPVIDTLLPFSSENEDKVYLLSHRGFKAFQLFFESSMMIYRGDIPILDVPFLHLYPP
ncbi:hypothetical protein Tco_0871107 [Tanacetum coccineum]